MSTVGAISLAASFGQKIFSITQDIYASNPDFVSRMLFGHSQDTRERIQVALDAGYEVSVHESPIFVDGWTGAGFAIIDPKTGAGGYLIEGGASGASFQIPSGLPVCAGFWSALWTNFVTTNQMIPGLALPTGVTLMTGSFVVEVFGGVTFLKVIFNWSALVAAGLQGVAILASLMVAAINFVLMSLAFEVGILLGSALMAANETCRRE